VHDLCLVAYFSYMAEWWRCCHRRSYRRSAERRKCSYRWRRSNPRAAEHRNCS